MRRKPTILVADQEEGMLQWLIEWVQKTYPRTEITTALVNGPEDVRSLLLTNRFARVVICEGTKDNLANRTREYLRQQDDRTPVTSVRFQLDQGPELQGARFT